MPRRTFERAALLITLAATPPALAQPCFVSTELLELVSSKGMFTIDIDADGDIDIIAAAESPSVNSIILFENDGQPSPTYTPRDLVTGLEDPATVFAADLDDDADIDVVYAEGSSFSDEIGWLESDGAPTPSFTRHVISTMDTSILAVHIADINGDDDPDIVATSAGNSVILWFENDGNPDPAFTRHVLSNDGARDIDVADIDDDGDLDVAAGAYSPNAIVWYESDGADPPTFTRHQFPSQTHAVTSIVIQDVNDDQHLDLVSASQNANTVAWHQSDGATPPTFTTRNIHTGANLVRDVSTADIDRDGDIDVLAAYQPFATGTLMSYLNDGNAVPTFTLRAIDNDYDNAQTIIAADLDADGDADIVAASQDTFGRIDWYENADARNLTTATSYDTIQEAIDDAASIDTIEAGARAFQAECAIDIDFLAKPITVASVGSILRNGDTTTTLADGASLNAAAASPIVIAGELSLPTAAQAQIGGDPVALSGPISLGAGAQLLADGALSIEGSGGFSDRRTISSTPNGPESVFAIDLDADGDVDVLSASTNDSTIAWYDNDGASPPAFTRRVISSTLSFADEVHAADMDGDGHTDVVAANAGGADVYWYESNGATPPLFTPHLITSAGDIIFNIRITDLDANGHLDVVVANYLQNTIAWLDNDGASPPSFTRRIIGSGIGRPYDIAVADLDDDGDLDVVSSDTTSFTRKILWYESDGASPPSFTPHTILVDEEAFTLATADMDADGDIDIVAGAGGPNPIRWLRNDGGTPPTFTELVVATSGTISSVYGLVVADLDDDGDPDVLAASAISNAVLWFESTGGSSPTFIPTTLDNQSTYAWDVAVGDLDADGDLDAIAAADSDDRIDWYENFLVSSLNLTDGTVQSLDSLAISNKRVVLGTLAELSAAGAATLDRTSTLTGSGNAIATTLDSAGTIEPDPAVSLTIDADYTQSFNDGLGLRSGTLAIDLGAGPDTASLAVTGSADLQGTLLVTTDDTLDPMAVGTPTLLTATSINSTRFDVALLPNVGSSDFLSVVYDEGGAKRGALATVSLTVNPLSGDVELDPQASADSNAGGIPTGATLADLDNDNDADLLIALPDANNPTTAPGSVVVLYNADDGNTSNGWEGFGATLQITTGIGINPSAVAVAPMDDDAQPDIIVANRGTPGDFIPDTISVLLVSDPSAGSFATSNTTTTLVGNEPADLIAADLDADGGIDIAVANAASHSVSVAWNSRVGTGLTWGEFDALDEEDLPEDDECPLSIRPGDFDGGLPVAPFLATANEGNDSIGLIEIGPGRTLTARPNIPVDAEPRELIVADLDNDGRDDVATVNRAGNSISIALNTSTTSLSLGASSDLPIDASSSLPRSITAGDLDDDGDTDLAVLADSVVKVLRNDLTGGGAGNLAFTPLPDQSAGDAPLLLRSADLNNDDRDDVVTIAESTGAKSLSRGTPPPSPINTLLAAPPPPACIADLDGDNDTDVFDFNIFAPAFGTSLGDPGFNPAADLDNNNTVDVFDFNLFAPDFGCGS